MPATAMDRRLPPFDIQAEGFAGAAALGRSWPLVLPLLIGVALAALSVGSGTAGACSGTGLALADLPGAAAALRGAPG